MCHCFNAVRVGLLHVGQVQRAGSCFALSSFSSHSIVYNLMLRDAKCRLYSGCALATQNYRKPGFDASYFVFQSPECQEHPRWVCVGYQYTWINSCIKFVLLK
ncbi:unnamed protein product [Meganyctiphanes norvegica]|uniref:Secreted protein n=1 Tax=Meganyctiphanes norvegica TaxID=48144 RepID=A0AAV2SCE9_MEGNR